MIKIFHAAQCAASAALVIHDATVRRGNDVVLGDLSLVLGRADLLFLVGAGGSGKSTLLMALGDVREDVSLEGAATWCGTPLRDAGLRIAFLAQRARADRAAEVQDAVAGGRKDDRAAAVFDLLRKEADLYLLDEPTAGLDEVSAGMVRGMVRARARQACVVFATHNRRDCLLLGGKTALIAGGTLQECADSQRFFADPQTPAARNYVATGNCAMPRPRASVDADGIWWLIPGLLCGMSRPGVVAEADRQLRKLCDAGVRTLVCLEERLVCSREQLRPYALQTHHFPVADMRPPTFPQALDLCRAVEPEIRENRGIAVHCRGGLGRTGTMLGAILVWFGETAVDAIAKVTAACPAAIQTDAQEHFIHDFAERIRNWR